MGIKEIIKDYQFMKKRIEIEYDIRMNYGGMKNNIHDAWETASVGFDNSCPGDIRASSAILASSSFLHHCGIFAFHLMFTVSM